MNLRVIATFVAPPLAIAAIAATYSSSITLVWVGRPTLLVLAVAAAWLGLKAFRTARSAQDSPAPFPLITLTQRGLAWTRGGSSSPAAAIVLLISGALPLFVYPLLYVFGVFGALGVAESGSFIDMVWLGIVLFPAVIYPGVYLLFTVVAIRRLWKKEPAVRASSVPVIYLAVAGVFIALACLIGSVLG